MNRPENRDSQTGNVPPGWTPEADADRQWKSIAQLLREADVPREPARAEFESIRAAVLQEIRRDNVQPIAATTAARDHDSFVPWVRQIFVGGGPAAQALRLAAVGLLGFVLAQNIAPRPPATQPVSRNTPHEVASVPAIQEYYDHPQMPTVRTVASNSVSTPDYLDRSGLDDWGVMKSNGRATADLGIGGSSAAAGNNWYAYSHFGGSPVAVSSSSSRGESAMELLQQLRLNAVVNNDEQAIQALRTLEEKLAPMLVREDRITPQQSEILELLRRAEQLGEQGRPREALESYDEIAQRLPGSFLAFTAEFQAARLNFEIIQDYEEALRRYRNVMEKYPPQYLSEKNQEHIRQRIALLAGNYAQDWQAVRLWQQAQNAPGHQREELLGQLVVSVPQSPLASEAARRLVNSRESRPANQENLVRILDQAITRAQGTPQAASLQFSKAEIIYENFADPELAIREYQKVLEMPGSQELAPKVNLRLQQLTGGKN